MTVCCCLFYKISHYKFHTFTNFTLKQLKCGWKFVNLHKEHMFAEKAEIATKMWNLAKKKSTLANNSWILAENAANSSN